MHSGLSLHFHFLLTSSAAADAAAVVRAPAPVLQQQGSLMHPAKFFRSYQLTYSVTIPQQVCGSDFDHEESGLLAKIT
jgi:hypothetical protein